MPVANPLLTDPPSLQLLFPAPLEVSGEDVTRSLRDYHADLAQATAELLRLPAPPPLPEGTGGPPALIGLIGWSRHVVKVVGFDAPMPASVLDRSVQPAHYDPQLKEAAYQHAAHVLLYYAGYESDVLEQHVALSVAAGVLARFGALVTLNEEARTSVPAQALLPHEEDGGDTIRALRELPLPFLFVGFLKLEVEGEPGVWMQTFGSHAFGLPDLAMRAEGHEQGTATFNLFSHMLSYLRESGQTFVTGDTIQAGEGRFLRIRDRTAPEAFLESSGRLLVVESISAEEANS